MIQSVLLPYSYVSIPLVLGTSISTRESSSGRHQDLCWKVLRMERCQFWGYRLGGLVWRTLQVRGDCVDSLEAGVQWEWMVLWGVGFWFQHLDLENFLSIFSMLAGPRVHNWVQLPAFIIVQRGCTGSRGRRMAAVGRTGDGCDPSVLLKQQTLLESGFQSSRMLFGAMCYESCW